MCPLEGNDIWTNLDTITIKYILECTICKVLSMCILSSKNPQKPMIDINKAMTNLVLSCFSHVPLFVTLRTAACQAAVWDVRGIL